MHANEIPLDIALVRKLVKAQFPQYAALSVQQLDASGSSNRLYRLGDDLLVRMPGQPGGGVAIAKERRWLPEIGRHLPVAAPEIVALGQPALGYGEHWSVLRWIRGDLAKAHSRNALNSSERSNFAVALADVVLALRNVEVPKAASKDPALRWYRGRSLAEFDQQTRRNIAQCRSLVGLNIDLDAAVQVWEHALTLPGANVTGPERWYHSDLVAENLLLQDKKLVAVLDFGGLAVGDATIDLHGVWEVLDAPEREVFRSRLGAGEAEWLRGRAWALSIALGAFAYYWKKMPDRMRDRMVMAQSVLADADVSR